MTEITVQIKLGTIESGPCLLLVLVSDVLDLRVLLQESAESST
jgi:hypothetical protein